MDAALGSNPSFVWRSLPQARELLTEGLAWKIGDGETVGIDSHKWLPNPPRFKPGAVRTLRVSALFNPKTKQWDRSLIHAFFHNRLLSDFIDLWLGSTLSLLKISDCGTKSEL